jgi:hypothetical protein
MVALSLNKLVRDLKSHQKLTVVARADFNKIKVLALQQL